MAVRNRVSGACFDAVAAKNAARIVDVVRFCITLAGGNSLLCGVFSSLDEDAVRGAGGGAQKARNALLKAVLVALQHVYAAIAGLNARRRLRKILRGRFAEHIPKRDAEALDQGAKSFRDFSNNGWHVRSLYQIRLKAAMYTRNKR